MRNAALLTVLAVILGLALPGHANGSPTALVAAKSCRSVQANDGFSTRSVRVKRIGCPKARGVLRRWLAAGGRPFQGPRTWKCTNSRGRFTCRNSGRVIAYTYVSDEP